MRVSALVLKNTIAQLDGYGTKKGIQERVQVEGTSKGLLFRRTDLETMILTLLPHEVPHDFVVSLPYKGLRNAARALTGEAELIPIVGDGGEVTALQVGMATLTTERVEEGKALPTWEEREDWGPKLNLPEDFRKALTLPWVGSKPADNPALAGILLSQEEGSFHMVSTNGHMLSVHSWGDFISGGNTYDITLPTGAVTMVKKHRKGGMTMIQVNKGGEKGVIHLPGAAIIFRNPGRFPKWRNVLPKDIFTTWTGNPRSLREAIEQMKPIWCESRDNIVTLETERPNILRVSAEHPEVGNGRTDVVGGTLGGDPEAEVHLNAKYLLQALRFLPQDGEVTLGYSGEGRPMEVRGTAGFLSVIMPVRK